MWERVAMRRKRTRAPAVRLRWNWPRTDVDTSRRGKMKIIRLQRALTIAAAALLAACEDSGYSVGPAGPASFSFAEFGSKIAFTSDREGSPDGTGDEQIFVMDADGSDQRRITDGRLNGNGAAWSPNGKSIAFHSNRAGGTDIFTMNADGSDPVRLTNLTALGLSAHFAD